MCLNSLNFHLSFDYCAILVFCKFGLVNLKTQCGLHDSLWEKIYVFHNIPQHTSTATIFLDLAISPSCQFSLGLRICSFTSVDISAIQFCATWPEHPQWKQTSSRLFVLSQSKSSYLVQATPPPLPWWCALFAYKRFSSLMVQSMGVEREGWRVSLSPSSLSAAVISFTEGLGVQSERFVQTAANRNRDQWGVCQWFRCWLVGSQTIVEGPSWVWKPRPNGKGNFCTATFTSLFLSILPTICEILCSKLNMMGQNNHATAKWLEIVCFW